MSDHLQKAISRIRELAPGLNKAIDEAAEAVKMVERFLNEECSVGIPQKVLCCDEPAKVYLTYGRVNGKYRIAVERYQPMGEDVSATLTVWSECTGIIKLSTFEKLPDLLGGIGGRMNSMLRTASAAVTAAETIRQAIIKSRLDSVGEKKEG